ncbi:MAG: hypothetical protein LAP87_16270 [Acidobacteriia bacterium]|nr:hypothetical protein [Terriglobia bacterium]
MVPGKLVHLIETHSEQIVARVVSHIRRDPELTHLRALLDSELREWGQDLLQNLGHWLSPNNLEDLARQYERLGRLRCEEGIPLEESVRGLCLVREKILDYVEEQVPSNSSLELYAEEQLERRLGRCFDLLLIHLVRGYERALRKAALASA